MQKYLLLQTTPNFQVSLSSFVPLTFLVLLKNQCELRHPCTILVEICNKLKLAEPSYEFFPYNPAEDNTKDMNMYSVDNYP
jgi:hypothetical protein